VEKLTDTQASSAREAPTPPVPTNARELKSAAVTTADLGNPFFVQIARGAESKAKEMK
jgi:ABC-type sugar transport system substrate-binding protein